MPLKSLLAVLCVIVPLLFCQLSAAQNLTADSIIVKQPYDSEILKQGSILKLSQQDSYADTIQYFAERSQIAEREAIYKRWKKNFPPPMVHSRVNLESVRSDQLLRLHQQNDWKFYLSFFLLAVLALIRYSYSREFDELSSVFKNWGPSQQMYRELGTGASFGTVLLNLFSAGVLSFYVFLLLYRYDAIEVTPAWVLMLLSVAAVSAFLLARYASLKVTSLLLPFKKEIALYNYYEIQINQTMSVWLFPLTLLIAFAKSPLDEYALYASFLVLLWFILCRYIKGFNIGLNYFGRHLFHFLLYICALEIAPVVIIIRLILNLAPLSFSY